MEEWLIQAVVVMALYSGAGTMEEWLIQAVVVMALYSGAGTVVRNVLETAEGLRWKWGGTKAPCRVLHCFSL